MAQLTLTRLSGFDRNKQLPFAKDAITLGTDASCDVRFDPTWDKSVSAQHCTLEFRGDAWWAKDSSKDGLFVAGRKVSLEKLPPGAVLELGKGGPKVQVDFVSASAATAPATAAPRPTVVADPPFVPHAAAPAAAAPATRAGQGPNWKMVAAAGVLLAVIAAIVIGKFLPTGKAPVSVTPDGGPTKAADQALADVAKEYQNAVGLVVLVHEGLEGGAQIPLATAWAVGPRVFATNSHVSTPVSEVLAKGGAAYIVINRTTDKKLRIIKAVIHPKYGSHEINFEGKGHALEGASYDVGLLYVEEDAPKVFKLAPRSELEKLDSGYRVAYLGFPMEGIAGGGVEVRSPVATMQSGIVTSNTDFWLAQSSFEKRYLVQHNMGSAGGASGSPIFNARGEIVAILNAGNVIGQVSFATGKVIRAPSGAMVNYAQRVDLLRDIWPDYPAN